MLLLATLSIVRPFLPAPVWMLLVLTGVIGGLAAFGLVGISSDRWSRR